MSLIQKWVAKLGIAAPLTPLAMFGVMLGTGCNGNPYGIDGGPAVSTTSAADTPTEWVDFHLEIPVDAGAFDPLASGMFGTAAQAGHFLAQQEISQGVYVTSEADPTTIDQVRLTFAFDDGSGTPRTLAVTPASFSVAEVFINTVDAAIAQLQSDVATNNAGGEIFDLEYQTTSTQGGTLSFGLKGNQGAYTLVLDVSSPHTSLLPGFVGTAAASGLPYDYVSGTVNFTMSQDEFDYFVGHAYGAGATGGQNFNDFELVPYQWLRLTVTPNLPQNIVNVGFDVTTTSGSSIALAQAPASVMAGSTFQALVDRMMATMTSQEAAQAGSSIPWTIPFYYDQPTGGGVVQVIASGLKGIFSVAYSVASPQHPLLDVPFVAYKSVTFPPPDPNASTPCYLQDAGYTQALNGIFQITFSASTAITNHLTAGQQLVGDIGCSIYYSNDVTVTGPNPGVVSLEDFLVPHANLLAPPAPSFTTTTPLADGEYQILCAQYVDGNDNDSDEGDPVTLPIGGFTIACGVNPAAVQFAILDPETQ